MSYDYDIFLSYHRAPPVGDWVRNHFHQLLEQWLTESVLGHAPQIFLDTQVRTGTDWQDELGHALLHSRFLVPVWSPSYYRARWCTWELASMRAREDALGLRTNDNRGQAPWASRWVPRSGTRSSHNAPLAWRSPVAHPPKR